MDHLRRATRYLEDGKEPPVFQIARKVPHTACGADRNTISAVPATPREEGTHLAAWLEVLASLHSEISRGISGTSVDHPWTPY
jgi:hypothetical protein